MAGPGVVQEGNFFSITGIAEDWTPEMIFGPSGMFVDIKIKRIELLGGSGGKWGNWDKVIIRHGSLTGPTICTLFTPYPQRIDRVYFRKGGQYMSPYIKLTDGYFNTGHVLVFEVA